MLLAAVAALVVLAVDQASKGWAQASLPNDRSVFVVPHWLAFRLRFNSGASFSFLSGHNGLLAVVTLVLLLAIAVALRRGLAGGVAMALGLGAILGGGASNLLDRVRLSAVVDFIQFRLWPADFNLADVAIRVGALTLVLAVVLRQLRLPRSTREVG